MDTGRYGRKKTAGLRFRWIIHADRNRDKLLPEQLQK